MKIIQANKYYYPRGGAEIYMLALSRWLEQQGSVVFPFAMRHGENLQSPFEKYFVSQVMTEAADDLSTFEKFRTFGRMLYSLESRRKLATLIVEQKPDLCHIHNIYTQISPSILHTLSDRHIPTVMSVHDHHLISPQYNIWAEGCGENYRRIGLVRGSFSRFHKNSVAATFAQIATYKFHRLMRIYEKHIQIFIVPSVYMKRQLVCDGFSPDNIRVNPYGIDVHTIEPSYKHDGYFLYVGRLSEEKGVEMIIHIAKLLPDIRFKIVGRGPQMAYLHRLGIDVPNVEFLGYRCGDELAKLYRDACAVLLPSRVHEVFPLVLLEAMAAGKPVIASHVGGIGEVVEDRMTGMLVHPTDLPGWTEATLRLYHDTDLHARLSRNAVEAARQKFSLEDHYRRLMNIYQEVTNYV